jgi:hypothetical protein
MRQRSVQRQQPLSPVVTTVRLERLIRRCSRCLVLVMGTEDKVALGE